MINKFKKIISILLCVSLTFGNVNMISFSEVISTLSTPILETKEVIKENKGSDSNVVIEELEESLEEVTEKSEEETYAPEKEEDEEASPSDIEETTENENDDEKLNETPEEESEVASKSDIEENIATESEPEEKVSTDSDADKVLVEKIVSTISYTSKINLSDKSLYEQLKYYGEDYVSYTDDKIVLNEDILIDNTLFVHEDANLDLNSHSIIISTSAEAFYIYDASFSLYNENDIASGSIISTKSDKSVIKAIDADLKLYGGEIKKEFFAEAIYAENSNLLIDGAKVFGGKGEDEIKVVGGDGYPAIIFKTDSGKKIEAKNGYIEGGQGGQGKDSKNFGKGGEGVIYNNFGMMKINYYGPSKGIRGDKLGGGIGGNAIEITSDIKDSFIMGDCYVVGGKGGLGLTKNRLLFKAASYPTKFDAREYKDKDGTTRNILTSIKNQASTGICWDFSSIANAEAGIIKNDPDYAKSLIATTESELDFSEIQTAYYYRNIPDDPLGNAGHAYTGGDIFDGGSPVPLDLYFTARRGISLGRNYKNKPKIKQYMDDIEYECLMYGMSNDEKGLLFYDLTGVYNKTKIANIINDELSAGDEFKYDSKVKPRETGLLSISDYATQDEYVKAIREAIYDHGTVQLFIPNFDQNYDTKTTYNGENCSTVCATSKTAGGGHAVLAVGYDDSFPKEKFGITQSKDGAFLIKNSWGDDTGFYWIPYTYPFADTMDAIWREWEKSEANEKMYYADGGLGYGSITLNTNYGIGNVFKIKEDEVLKNLGYYSIGNFDKVNLYIYKASGDTKSSLASFNTFPVLYKLENQSIRKGYNSFSIPSDVKVKKDDYVFVYIKNVGSGASCGIGMDNGNFITTYAPNKSFITYPLGTIYEINEMVGDCNVPIRLLTEKVSSYTIKYDLLGLDATTPSSIKKLVGVNVSLTTPSDIKGYNFYGWYKEKELKNRYYGNTDLTTTPSEIKTIYAKWEPIHYTLSLNPNPSYQTGIASTSEIKKVYAYNENIVLSNPGFTSTTHTFDGWTENADGTGTSYIENQTVSKLSIIDNDTITLYVKWVPGSYKIIFDKNDTLAEGTMDYQTVEVGKTVTLNENLYTKKGYSFEGWATSSTAKAIYVDKSSYNNSSIKKDETCTLYAKWKPNTYKIKYNANNGTITPSFETKTYNTNIDLATPSRIGYSFEGWYEDNNTFNISYDGTRDLSENQNDEKNIYAKWIENTYTLKFDLLGVNATTPSNIIKTYTKNVTLLPPTNLPPGYSFLGWYVDITLNSEYKGTGDLSNTSGDIIILYAKWKKQIIFDANGHGVNPGALDVISSTITLPDITCSGYIFGGWYEEKECINFVGNGRESYSVSKPTTLYAKWTPIKYTLKYNNITDATIASTSAIKTYGINVSLASPSKTGYIFNGWYKENTYKNKYNGIEDLTINNGATVNIYAKWTAITYTIIYNVDGHAATLANKTKTYNTNYVLPKPSNIVSGYTFVDWYSDNAFTKKYDGTSDLSTTDKDTVNLYARWKAKVTYNANGHGVAPNATDVLLNDSIILSTLSNVTGYTFDTTNSWYEEADCTTLIGASGANYVVKKPITLYAKWDPNVYNITLYTNGGTINSGNVTSYTYGIGATLPTDVRGKRASDSFVGWYSNSSFAGNKYTSVSKTDIGDKEFYAKYAIKHTITFNANGGSGSMPIQEVYENESFKINVNKFSKNGYSFAGWKSNENISYSDGAIINNLTKDLVLSAQWKQSSSSSGSSSSGSSSSGGSGGGGGGGGGSAAKTSTVNPLNPTISPQTQPALANNINSQQALYEGPASKENMTPVTGGQVKLNEDGSISYVTKEGTLLSGWQKVENNGNSGFYFFTRDNKMYTGWMKDPNGDIYHLGADGSMDTKSIFINGKVYTFDEKGKFVGDVNEIKSSGQAFVEACKGAWSQDSLTGKMHYNMMTSDGKIVSTFVSGLYNIQTEEGEKIFMFDKNGDMLTGFQVLGQRAFYFDENGIMTAEIKIENGIARIENADLSTLPLNTYSDLVPVIN